MDVTLKTTEEVERFFQETDNVLLGPPPKMKNAQIVFTEKAHTGKCILCCGEDVTFTGGKLVFAGPGAIVYLAETPRCGWMQRCMLDARLPWARRRTPTVHSM